MNLVVIRWQGKQQLVEKGDAVCLVVIDAKVFVVDASAETYITFLLVLFSCWYCLVEIDF